MARADYPGFVAWPVALDDDCIPGAGCGLAAHVAMVANGRSSGNGLSWCAVNDDDEYLDAGCTAPQQTRGNALDYWNIAYVGVPSTNMF